jgi:hypothetical protein
MPALANYTIIVDTPSTLAAGAAQSFAFGVPALDAGVQTILLFRVMPNLNAGLEITINNVVVFSVPAFNVVGVRSMHEVVPAGIVLTAGNTVTATNTGAASLSFSGVALLFTT